jgi:protein-disulfide isomerase
MEPSQEQSSSPAIPIAIVVGFGMIALAIFFTNGRDVAPTQVTQEVPESAEEVTSAGPRPVDETDYIRGNPNAPILLIEYSDYDCPFCKQFHSTMKQVMEDFGVDGRVAWVYRQFPIEQLHPNSPRISEAALCVGDIGGQTAFWQFSDLIFEQREFDAPTNVVRLPDYAERVGVDRDAYNACMNSGRMQQAVLDSVKDGFDAGIRGTPYTYVVAGNQQAVINGARSYETISGIVNNLIEQLNGNFDPENPQLPEELVPVNENIVAPAPTP